MTRAQPREHGTRAKYVVEKCRCDACREVCRDYERWRLRQKAYGRTAYVDAAPVRAYIRGLRAAGLGWKRVADRAGIAESTMWKLIYGDPKRRQAPSRRVRRRTARAILAVTCDLDALGATVHVPAVGTARRLRALVAIGWSQSKLAQMLGKLPANLGKTMTSEQVAAGTARAVRDLYDRLWDRPPPESTWSERQSASRARNLARRNGWVPPLAWDDDALDDPEAVPQLGEPDPVRPGRGRALVDLAEVDHLAAFGCSLEEIAARMGVGVGAIERARYRAAERAAA